MAEDNINTVQALINICILVRQLEPVMPHDELIQQRTINKNDVNEHLKQANSFKQLCDSYQNCQSTMHLLKTYGRSVSIEST